MPPSHHPPLTHVAKIAQARSVFCTGDYYNAFVILHFLSVSVSFGFSVIEYKQIEGSHCIVVTLTSSPLAHGDLFMVGS